MNILKKTIILTITVLFLFWGQLSASQISCNCNLHKQHQKESILSKNSCCMNQHEMKNCHSTQSEQPEKSRCHKVGMKVGLNLPQHHLASEFCQSNCVVKILNNLDSSSLTKTIDVNLILYSPFLKSLLVDLTCHSIQHEYVFQNESIPIFLLNASFLI